MVMVVLESRLVRTYKIGLAIVSGLLANPAHAAGGASPSIGGHNVYYGDLHSHTSLSDGSGTPDQAFTHARDAGKLDFFGVSEHDYWPEDMTDQKWNTLKDAANTHNQDGTFVAFWGFEWTSDVPPDGLGLGHFTVVNSEDYCNSTKEPTRTLNQFVTWLSTRDAVAIFNHPGQYNTTFDEFIFDHTDNIVGMELWNRSQDYYSKTGFHGDGYFDEALREGWRIGAAGGQDNHGTDWGTKNEWRIAVLAPKKTRASIFEALKARRFYSSRDKNLALSFICNGSQMGSSVGAGTLACEIEAFDGDNESFASIELLRNGSVIETWTPNDTHPTMTSSVAGSVGDYFYVRVYQSNDWTAISSPIWVTSAESRGAGGDGGPKKNDPKCPRRSDDVRWETRRLG